MAVDPDEFFDGDEDSDFESDNSDFGAYLAARLPTFDDSEKTIGRDEGEWEEEDENGFLQTDRDNADFDSWHDVY